MSALRRRWRAVQFEMEHAGYRAVVSRLSPEVWVWRAGYASGREATLTAAQDAAEQEIEHRLAQLSREEILLESANVDCREVRS